ncbi:hypothetical protein T552_00707 [Pneumocystis carinii B80]|uniref:Glycolipid transfer protein domain-containing protein n=1 Tax=Pneumocystis carinii (strain B80) TaxID=1408658 RepID=A0A0W4ZPC9_PNEC8|nr:hypothetical protein T552_00707 [Pneumocystis carinii B80]KTW30229.1 hypothetical protein T552_00707 [Pneumocystis carinii B80]
MNKMSLKEDNSNFGIIKMSFKDISVDESGIDASDFLLASKSFVDVFDLFDSKIFSVIRNDINGNLKKIRCYLQKYPSHGKTLESLVRNEALQKKRVATEGLLWLLRGFVFMSHALHRNMENENEELSVSFTKAYEITLKRHHSIFIRPIFTMAMKYCPSRNDFYSKLSNDKIKLRAFLCEWLSGLDKIILSLQNFYENGQYAKGL